MCVWFGQVASPAVLRVLPCTRCRLLGGLEAWELSVDSMREDEHQEAQEAEAEADAVPEDIPEPNAGAADTEASAAAEALPGPLADAGVLIGLEQLLAQLRTCPAAVQATTLDQVRAGLVAGT